MSQNNFIKNPQLDGSDFYWSGSQTGVLLIHGFTATTAEVRLVAERLHQAGYTVAGPLLPGHGTHPDDLNRARWPMWLERVKLFYEKLLRDCTQIFVIGESMGALLALELAAQHPEIMGVMLFAPGIKVNRLWLANILAPFKAYIPKKGKDDRLFWKGYNVDPLRGAAELRKLQKHARRQLSKIKQPTLVFTGEYDRTIASDSAEIILKGIQSRIKHHQHMEKSAHCILLDQEQEEILQTILAFMENPKQQPLS